MNSKNIFDDVFVSGEILRVCPAPEEPTRSNQSLNGEAFIKLKPVAWSWFYLGPHVTVDRHKAEELLAYGEVITPLYMVVN